MKKDRKTFQLTLVTAELGTVPKDPEVYKKYIGTLAPSDEAALEEYEKLVAQATISEDAKKLLDMMHKEVEEKGWTTFFKDEKGMFIYDYMIKGFMKSAMETLMVNGTIPKVGAYKKWIERLIFIFPRQIYFTVDGVNQAEPHGFKERPLRVDFPERVTLVRSDFMNPGTRLEFEVELFKNSLPKEKEITWETINTLFEYGEYMGLGQWRSGGWGRFTHQITRS